MKTFSSACSTKQVIFCLLLSWQTTEYSGKSLLVSALDDSLADVIADGVASHGHKQVVEPQQQGGQQYHHRQEEEEGKRLVFFAGPHYSATTSITKFFAENTQKGGLVEWCWPSETGPLASGLDDAPHTIFGRLVTNPDNEALRNELLDSIYEQWNNASTTQRGMIIGTPEFDRVGQTPSSHWNGIEAMKLIQNKLATSATPISKVTVVLNYRVPRLDHWVSLFKHESADTQTHYKKFVCGTREGEQWWTLWEALNSGINPLYLATEYLKQGWNVVMIDMGGVEKGGRDISHVIGCNVLNAHCGGETHDPGLINGVFNIAYHENHLEHNFMSLGDEKEAILEQLLRKRDCIYKDVLEGNPDFQVLQKDSLWENCPPMDDDMIEKLKDTTNVLDAIRSQKGCNSQPISMSDLVPDAFDNPSPENSPNSGTDNEELATPVQSDNDAAINNHNDDDNLPDDAPNDAPDDAPNDVASDAPNDANEALQIEPTQEEEEEELFLERSQQAISQWEIVFLLVMAVMVIALIYQKATRRPFYHRVNEESGRYTTIQLSRLERASKIGRASANGFV